jgi:DNA invertase Pin-like site-specific DNA recombinase
MNVVFCVGGLNRPGGKLIFHLMGALTEFERDLIRERKDADLAAARARGRVGGRPRRLATNGKVPSLSVCLLTRIIPSQRFVRHLESSAQHSTAT